VSVVDDLVANNEAFAASLPPQHLDVRPSRHLVIVTCMDARLDVFAVRSRSHSDAWVRAR
jgi:carbonic anhydrase